VRQYAPRCLIIRTASLLGSTRSRGKGGNFVETILAKAKAGDPLRIVNDICMSPIYRHDAARMLVKLIEANPTGLLHLTNQGSCTWYEFAKTTLKTSGLPGIVEPVNSLRYASRALRPVNSSLVTERIQDAVKECGLSSWRNALQAYVTEKGIFLADKVVVALLSGQRPMFVTQDRHLPKRYCLIEFTAASRSATII
jgi:dTDP-4-dehydrorhamnose reductase